MDINISSLQAATWLSSHAFIHLCYSCFVFIIWVVRVWGKGVYPCLCHTFNARISYLRSNSRIIVSEDHLCLSVSSDVAIVLYNRRSPKNRSFGHGCTLLDSSYDSAGPKLLPCIYSFVCFALFDCYIVRVMFYAYQMSWWFGGRVFVLVFFFFFLPLQTSG